LFAVPEELLQPLIDLELPPLPELVSLPSFMQTFTVPDYSQATIEAAPEVHRSEPEFKVEVNCYVFVQRFRMR